MLAGWEGRVELAMAVAAGVCNVWGNSADGCSAHIMHSDMCTTLPLTLRLVAIRMQRRAGDCWKDA